MSFTPQFSIKAILAATAVVALAVWVLTAQATWYSAIVALVLVVAFPSVSLGIAIYGSGFYRAFFVGALVPFCMSLFYYLSILQIPPFQAREWYGIGRVCLLVHWPAAIAMGLIVAGTYWAIARRRADR